jgi:malonate transporter and related proteins
LQTQIFDSLTPVVLLVLLGVALGKAQWITQSAAKDMSAVLFTVAGPALLFRTMVHLKPDFGMLAPLAVYFAALLLVFGATLAIWGLSTRSAIVGLAVTFSNTVMVGIPLTDLLFGQAGLGVLLPIVSIHALVLLTTATFILEMARSRQRHQASVGMLRTLGQAAKQSLLHPVPLPILAGLAFGATGLAVPAMVDKPLLWLGQCFGPLALVLVGVNTAYGQWRAQAKAALGIAALKNLAMPALVFALGRAAGIDGTALAVITCTAALPVGANVFLFSQRYEVAQALVSAAVTVSTALALVSLPLVLLLVTN